VAVAAMLTLPEQAAFETFHYCTTCVQTDMDRVRQVACVGMAVASLWGNQVTLLEECCRMRVNAVWWQRLHAMGIRLDMKLFLTATKDYKRCVLSRCSPVPSAAS
jgi:hypothetical protein